MDSSFVTKARTAFHNAAAKAERVLTEIKADLKADFGRPNSPVWSPTIQENERTGDLSWICKTELEKQHEDEICRRVLDISKKPEEFLSKQGKDDTLLDMAADMQSAGLILEYDKDLRNLRFHYVPKRMKEQEFWKCYFEAVNRVKQEVLGDDNSRNLKYGKENCEGREAFARDTEAESPRKDPMEEEAYRKAFSVVAIPSSTLVRRLAAAVEAGRSFRRLNELETLGKSEKDFSTSADWSGLVSGLAAMRKLSLRDKEGKLQDGGGNQALLWSLFDADTQYKDTNNAVDGLFQATKSRLPEEIHGAPPGSFIAQLAEIMAGMKTEQRMADFWSEVVSELRRRWAEGQPIPRLPVDADPDLRYCLLHQQLQVINCCIARKKRRASALELLDTLSETLGSVDTLHGQESDRISTLCSSQAFPLSDASSFPSWLFAKVKDGKLVLRLGADCQAENLRMLETGERVYSPVTQDGPVLTEDLIKETEELVLRTRSVGPGCSQLLSDMQAFKAANPGCILEDFVRWYSPPDWRQDPGSGPLVEESDKYSTDDNGSGERGYLSARMQCQGNLWQELWTSAKPIPAAKQTPLFDEDLAGESTLNELEDIVPVDLFEQLFIAVLGAGFAIAESAAVSRNAIIADRLRECKDYIISTCSKDMDAEKLEHLCQVYETMETIFQSPTEDAQDTRTLSSTEQVASEKVPVHSKKSGKHHGHRIGIERHLFRRPARDNHNLNSKSDSSSGLLSRFLEAKTSLFEKKQSKHAASEDDKKSNFQEGDWTIV